MAVGRVEHGMEGEGYARTDVSEKIQSTLSWHLNIKKNHVGLLRDERVDGIAVGTEGVHLAHLWHFL